LGAGFGFGSLSQALNTVISLVFLIAGLAAFVYILLGAFSYLTAGDDSAKTEKARKMITNAVVGLLLVALVYVIWIVAINLVPGLSDFFKATNG
jgi:glucose uptake protein GlcU